MNDGHKEINEDISDWSHDVCRAHQKDAQRAYGDPSNAAKWKFSTSRNNVKLLVRFAT